MSQQPFGDTQPLGSGSGHDGGDYLEIGGPPRRPGWPGRPGASRYLMSIAAVGLVALLGGAGVAYAVSGGGSSPSTTAAHPAASPSANPVNPAHPVHPKCANTRGPCRAFRFRPFGLGRIPFGFGFGIGVGAGLGLPGGLVHGQVVVSKPGGGYQTVDIQSGKVTAVSSTSITLKSADGYTASYSVASSTIVDAQRDYAALDPMKVGAPVYARRLLSSPGHKDGLYWDSEPGEPNSPLGPLLAKAQPGEIQEYGYYGYRFRLLYSQGPDAPGGAYNYLVKDRMVGGFAVIAWPVRWGETGVMTFMVSHDSDVYEKDLGPDTAQAAAAINVFNPDKSWDKADMTP